MSRTSPLVTKIVQAGAGTGKTESLAQEIISTASELYHQKKRLPKILAATFTERATIELRERVYKLISDKLTDSPWLGEFVQNDEKLFVTTIHGAFALILRKYAHLLDHDPDFKIINKIEEIEIYESVLRDIFSKTPDFSVLLEEFSMKDLILIYEDLLSYMKEGAPSFGVLSDWKTQLSAEIKNCKNYLEQFSEAHLLNLSPKTQEKLNQIAQFSQKLKPIPDDSFIEEFLVCFESFRKPTLTEKSPGAYLKDALDGLFEARDRFKESKATYKMALNVKHDQIVQKTTKLFKELTLKTSEQKKNQGVMSFDDLEYNVFELLQKQTSLIPRLQSEWDFWFIDEFQDTSPLQKKILAQLFQKPWNSYFVGDPQQSIYLFRGADVRVFDETKEQVTQMKGQFLTLSKNFRSHPDLLRSLNFIFDKIIPPMMMLEARDGESDDVRATLHWASDDVDEEDIAAYQILNWHKQGHAFHEMAILVKTNAQVQKVAQRLQKAQIPVFVQATGGYYDKREILDAISFLAFLENPGDDVNFVRIARSPWLGVSDEQIQIWAQAKDKQSFWQHILSLSHEQISRELNSLIQAVQHSEHLPLSWCFESLIENLGFLEFSSFNDQTGQREANIRKLIKKLKDAETQPHFQATKFISRIWLEFDRGTEESEATGYCVPQRVNIMTIHKSKGLKFNCVIVPYGSSPYICKTLKTESDSSGLFTLRILDIETDVMVSPLAMNRLKEQREKREFEESIRLFYVAITRAAEKLCLIGKENIKRKSWFDRVNGFNPDRSKTFEQEKLFKVHSWNETPPLQKTEGAFDLLPQDVDLSPAIKDRTKNSSSISVSEYLKSRFENKKSVPLKILLESQSLGLGLHWVFEKIKYDPNADLVRLLSSMKKNYHLAQNFNEDYFKNILPKTLEMKDPPLLEVMKRGEAEWSFFIRIKDILLEGQIDLWGIVDGVCWLIDYKTATDFSEDDEKRALRQLEVYALALKEAGVSWNQIKPCVVLLKHAKNKVFKLRPYAEVIDSVVGPH